MSVRDYKNREKVVGYLEKLVVESKAQQGLRSVTTGMEEGGMQISSVSGKLVEQIIGMVNGKKAIEVGVFTGYSTLSTALGLGEGGKVVACDISDEWTKIGEPFWEEAGVRDRIDLRIGNADETMQGLLDGGEGGTYDYIFVDADKVGYDGYYELGLKLLRVGGVILFDNMLWGGSVADDEIQDESTEALKALNIKLFGDGRVFASFLPFDDGMVLARKL